MVRKKVFLVVMVCMVAFPLWSGTALAEKPILIGSPLPLTGHSASDGEQMKMALELAVEEYNAAGGLLGRKLKIKFGDIAGGQVENLKAVGERLIGAGVDLVITGYDDGGADVKIFGEHDMPYLHSNTNSACTQPVAKNPGKYWNCFQYSWNEKAYGVDAANHLFNVPKEMGWTPPNKKIALIHLNWPYSALAAKEFRSRTEKMGYEIVMDETTRTDMVEWGPILSKISSTKPAYITFWYHPAASAAQFIKQFVDRFSSEGIDSIVFMQYTPAVPEFLKLAGKAADGVIWVGGTEKTGVKYEEYRKRWRKKYKKDPAGFYSVITRDGFDIWARAVKRAGCVDCYREVCRQIRESVYEGITATYVFNPIDQSAMLGEYLFPLSWQQIWDGKHIVTDPKRLKLGKYRKPPWIKK